MPFGIGPGELILILVVALVVFGPRRLPELGSSMGKALREFRRASNEITRELEAEVRQPQPPTAVLNPPAQAAASNGAEAICASCGEHNPATNKHCGRCGKELVAL